VTDEITFVTPAASATSVERRGAEAHLVFLAEDEAKAQEMCKELHRQILAMGGKPAAFQ
jgi:hypothetical protein